MESMKKVSLFLLVAVTLASAQSQSSQSSGAPPKSSLPVFARGHGFPGRSRGPDGQSPVTDLLTLLYNNVNSGEALANVRKMWESDRWFDFAHFQETAKTVADIMQRAGLEDVQIGYAPADGVTQAGFWTEPLAWDAHAGTLEIISPKVPEDMRVIADYQQVPASLCMWSGPTPAGGVETEIVLPPRDIRSADLKGKLVLGGNVPKVALAKAGALGMVHESTTNPALLDERDWVNSFGDKGWSFNKGDSPLVCFSSTPRSQQYLHQLLERGPVRVKVNVNTRYYAGKYPYVTGAILGTDGDAAEEVLSLGHIFEVGAGDNDTGVSAIVEAAATLNRLIKEGKLPRPKRTIRLLAMGERYGNLAYLYDNQERVKRTIAGMCIDSPAGFQNLAGTEYNWVLNPQSATSYVDAFVLRLAKEYFAMVDRPVRWSEYNSGTDNDLGNPMINIPTVAPRGGHGIVAHHTSFDTPSQVDPDSLRDLSVMNAAYAYFIASAEPDQMRWMAQLTLSRGYEQIAGAVENSLDQIAIAQNADALSHLLYWETARVDYNLARETKAIQQAADLKQGISDLTSFAESQEKRVEAAVQQRAMELHLDKIRPSLPKENAAAARIIVRRKRMGTITMDDIPLDEREGYPASPFWGPTTAALYWCDGKRSLAEVIKLTELEMGVSNFDWLGYFNFLERHGYVDLVVKNG